MKILVPISTEGTSSPKFQVVLPKRAVNNPKHFPQKFRPDRPAVITDMFAREIVALSENIKGRFQVYIDLPEFINETYPWIPYTLELHAIILAPECCVYFQNMDPIDYSDLIDKKRREKPFWGHSEPLHCIRNFVCYLCTKTGDRSGRVFEQTKTGLFVPFKERIIGKVDTSGFDEYYQGYVKNPYAPKKARYWDPQYFTHPFDHLPVKNLTKSIKTSYMTGPQLKAKKLPVPSINEAIFLHDQIETVTLRPYWKVPKKKTP